MLYTHTLTHIRTMCVTHMYIYTYTPNINKVYLII